MDKKRKLMHSYICCLQEIHFRLKDKHRLKIKGWKKKFLANRNERNNLGSNIVSDKIEFKLKVMIRDKTIFHSDKGINPKRECNPYKHFCTQHKSNQICKPNIDEHKWRERQHYSHSMGLWYPVDINVEIVQAKSTRK